MIFIPRYFKFNKKFRAQISRINQQQMNDFTPRETTQRDMTHRDTTPNNTYRATETLEQTKRKKPDLSISNVMRTTRVDSPSLSKYQQYRHGRPKYNRPTAVKLVQQFSVLDKRESAQTQQNVSIRNDDGWWKNMNYDLTPRNDVSRRTVAVEQQGSSSQKIKSSFQIIER